MNDSPPASVHAQTLRRLVALGLLLALCFGGGLVLWSAVVDLSSAVVANGQLVIDSHVKKVQHQSGGIVGEVMVKDGDFVRGGDLLVRLDDTITRTTLKGLLKKLDEHRARAARLEAERLDFRGIIMPSDLIQRLAEPGISELITTESQLFEVRASAHKLRKLRIEERIGQLRHEIAGLRHVLTARERQATVSGKELESLRTLQRQNLVQLQRINSVEREAINLIGEQGQLKTSIAQAEGRVIEAQMQLSSLDDELRVETTKELREVQAEVAQLEEKRIAAEDQLRRVEIRAPSTGYVHQSTVHTVGGVITNGEPVMVIVPTDERLEVEAKIAPPDIDQLHLNQAALVRLMAFNRRTMPDLTGNVVRIGADVIREPQTGATYFLARIALPPSETARLEGRKLTAGMQAEIFIQTGTKSPFEYLLNPLRDQLSRALRER